MLTSLTPPPAPAVDLSKIDFEALRSRFKESKQENTDLEVLKAAIRAQLEKLIRLDKPRTDFQELLEFYNAGSRNIEELFEELVKLSRSLSEEQQRHVRENMTEEELVIFDILTRPAPDLSAAERCELKKVAKLLLERVKALLVLDWRKRQGSRARVVPSRTCSIPVCRESIRPNSTKRNARRSSSTFTRATQNGMRAFMP